jgi:hypothetical protein
VPSYRGKRTLRRGSAARPTRLLEECEKRKTFETFGRDHGLAVAHLVAQGELGIDCVVGGGIAGLVTAKVLQEDGFDVLFSKKLLL